MRPSQRITQQVLKTSNISKHVFAARSNVKALIPSTFIQPSISGTFPVGSSQTGSSIFSKSKENQQNNSKFSEDKKIQHSKIGFSLLGMFLFYGLGDDG